MNFFRILKKTISNNIYLLLGIVLGIFSSTYFDEEPCTFDMNKVELGNNVDKLNNPKTNTENFKVQSIISRKPKTSKKSSTIKKEQDKLVRPRYYSTELGIREKLFVGVLTSEDRINSQAIYINKTIAHLVDKVKFFITAHNKMKTTFNLTGIVGFTDTRHRYRPFQIIKYVGDTFLQDYDYFYFINDYNYLDIQKLKHIVGQISVSLDVYLGEPVKDSSFCNLDAGILLSNSVIKAMKANLDWCTANAVSDNDGENLGRCVYGSINLECQEYIQGQSIPTYKLKHFQLEKYLKKLSNQQKFVDAVSVYPVLQANHFYLLNAYFSSRHLEKVQSEILMLSKNLNDTWPPGQRVAAKPTTRFDLPPQLYFNLTHMFFPDDFTNIRPHTKADYLDIEKIIEAIKIRFINKSLQYRRLVNGYRTFDLSRGMDYLLDIGFRDLKTGKEVIKRFEVCKPLSRVEFVPAPYVTENTKVTSILLVQETEVELAAEFINNFSENIMEKKEKILLMLALIYQYNSSSKGPTDIFYKLKGFAMELSNKYRTEEIKVIWVSIRLPVADKPITLEKYRVLNFAVVDLALKKIGLDSLTLILNVYANISIEFLNRVRMNTIANFQIFSPIPFRQYNPQLTHLSTFDVNKNVGHFDREEYRYISFYGRDYVFARKKSQLQVPIARTDNDIIQLINSTSDGNLFNLFLKYSNNLHCMRAVEKGLKVKYHEEGYLNQRTNLFFGTKLQLAKHLFTAGVTF